MTPPILPTSLLGPAHKQWIDNAIQILNNLQNHLDQAKRAGIPGIDAHQTIKDQHMDTLLRIRNTYFPQG